MTDIATQSSVRRLSTIRWPPFALGLVIMLLVALMGSTSSASASTDTLEPGQRLHAGDELRSDNHAYRLVMQGDGNLVIYKSGKPLWASHTEGHGGAKLKLQNDGNLVIYWRGKALWATHTEQPTPPSPPSAPAGSQPTPVSLTDTLEPGQRLHAGDELRSDNHAYRLVMQGDGNLVLYKSGKPLWASYTEGNGGANVVMQGDGNLVIYKSGKPLWASHTEGHGGAKLKLQNDGNLVIYKNGKALWATHTERSASRTPPKRPRVLRAGRWLKPGKALFSPNRRYRLVMQGDGNLVLYRKGRGTIWSTKTAGHRSAQAVMQGDGNFVVYWKGRALWATRTEGHGGAKLKLQNDGNLVIYWRGKALWASKSSGRGGGAWTSRPKGKWACSSSANGCVAHTGFRPNKKVSGNWGWWGQATNPQGNCTNYVAYRLIKNGASDPGFRGSGDAKNWRDVVRRNLGAKRVNGKPAVGAIAWYPGHVAYVEKVVGGSVYLSDSSWPIRAGVGGSSRKIVRMGGPSWPVSFLHVKDKPRR